MSTGGEILCRTLESLGARHVFGLPGTQNVELFEALRRSRLRTVLTTHELAASFMANGYARASGEVGVIFTIPGPGFAYALPGLAEARLDSAPLLHVVGQPAREPGRRFQHQAIPQEAMVAPLVKRVVTVERADALAAGVTEAWRTALAGEPGPVVLHLGPDVVGGDAGSRPRDHAPPTTGSEPPGEDGWVGALGRRVLEARHPLLFLGQGAAGASDAVQALAEAWPALVATTPSGRGVLPEDHPWSLAWDSLRSGVSPMNELLARCDLVLAVGCKLSHNGSAGFGLAFPSGALVHADASADVPGANYETSLAIHAEADTVLAHVREALGGRAGPSAWTLEDAVLWRTRLRGSPPPHEPRIHGLRPDTPEAFFRLLRERLPRNAIVVTDSGLHQYLVRHHLEVLSPRGLVMPSDFQSMGFGLPAAIGARLACPDRPVVAVIGDGGLAMSAMELLTAARERVDLTLVVFNDGQLNLIRHQQIRDWGHTHAVDLQNPDMAVLAEALGVGYGLLEKDPRATVEAALSSTGPTLLEVRLGDAPSLTRARVRSVAHATGRRVLGPRLLRLVKRLLGRG